MIVKETKCFVLNEPPYAEVNFEENDPNATFKLVTKPLRDLKAGEVLAKTIYLSNDPSQRAWIQKGVQADRMYVEPVVKGDIMRSSGLAQVVSSKSSKYQAGDLITGTVKWAEYVILREENISTKITSKNYPLPIYLDVLGMTGLTAYFGLLDVAKIKKSHVVVVSAASGATGSMCVQIAKNVVGCKKVIGISGGPEKCAHVESLGADVCVDYRSKTFVKDLKAALGEEKFCDVFFDCVGGKVLDVMLMLTKPFGKVVACGAIAGYNDFKQSRIAMWPQIITNRLFVQGFIVLDYQSQFPKALDDLLSWVDQGKISYRKSNYTVMDLTKQNDFRKIPESWGILFDHKKTPGKLLTQVAKPSL